MRYVLFLLSYLCFAVTVWAQPSDSTLMLKPERLQQKDIVERNVGLQPTLSISATRSPEAIEDLPYSIWVVKSEDILRYGFVTLGDVLRAAPGIRVSQPGNAQEGEMFLMRGVSGNQYVKILINDVPIKPMQTLGMPIGAQLPVRQAERIEVMYGAAGAIYGDEACAGVVNIILKESERPLYTQADLSVGNTEYNSLNLMFGGKLGKDKRIFRFNIYGSNTIKQWYRDEQIFTSSAMDMTQYIPFGFDFNLYRDNPHYTTNGAVNYSAASTLPHESRLLGASATWRGLQFNFNRMLRTDHTALGLNPVAISWFNPGNRLSESLEAFSLGFKTKRRHYASQHTLSVLRYAIDDNTTATYLYPRLVKDVYSLTATRRQDKAHIDSLFRKYAGGPRHAFGNDLNIRWETRVTASLTPRLYWKNLFIAQATLNGIPYATYLEPRRDGQFYSGTVFFSGPYDPFSNSGADLNLATQLEWRGKRLYLLGGILGNLSGVPGLDGKPQLAPRAAALYKIDSSWSVRANASTGFKSSGGYFYTNSSFIANPTLNILSVYNRSIALRELFKSYELGVRYRKGSYYAELYGYHQKAYNLIRPMLPTALSSTVFSIYDNNSGLSQSLWGIQGIARSENMKISRVGRRQKAELFGRTELYILYTRGKEYQNGAVWQNEVFNMPKWQRQFRTFFRLNKVEVMFATNWQSAVLSKSVSYKQFYELSNQLPERTDKFRSWDIMTRIYLSKYFVLYGFLQNAFGRNLSGLDATGTADDLVPLIQQGRQIRFGVNYNMN